MDKEFTKEWFDEASKEWMKNKRKLKNGVYKYRCQVAISNTKICNRDVFDNGQYCKSHYMKFGYHVNKES
jgi:hypothetical protein